MYEKLGQFIDGKWQQSSDKGTYDVINPATEEIIGQASKATSQDVDRALKSAEKGLQVWKKTAPWQRSYIIRKIADKIREKQDVLAKWMTLEVGKPLSESKGEIAGAADIFEWNAEETKRIFGQTIESRFEDTSACLLSASWCCSCFVTMEFSSCIICKKNFNSFSCWMLCNN